MPARPAAAFGRCWRQKGVPSVPPSSPKPAHRKDKRHCPQGYRLCPKIFDNAKGNGSGTFSGTVSRATVKHHRAMPQAWPCFFMSPPFQVGKLFHVSRKVTGRQPASAMSVATGRTAASPTAPSSPPASRHHHRTPMNDTAITTARALFPRGLHQPQDSYRFKRLILVTPQ